MFMPKNLGIIIPKNLGIIYLKLKLNRAYCTFIP